MLPRRFPRHRLISSYRWVCLYAGKTLFLKALDRAQVTLARHDAILACLGPPKPNCRRPILPLWSRAQDLKTFYLNMHKISIAARQPFFPPISRVVANKIKKNT